MEATVWGIHMDWDSAAIPSGSKNIAIGWPKMGDLSKIQPSREAFKAALALAYPLEKPGSVPIKAGNCYRFFKDIRIGDIVVYPSKFDRTVNIGVISSNYIYAPEKNADYPNQRGVEWKAHLPRAQFSQSALYEIGSAITLFQVSNNADEFLSALKGLPLKTAEVDSTSAIEIASQAEENIEDFIIKRLKNGFTPEQFEHFVAELLRCMGYRARVTRYGGDGGFDVIAHKDELGFEPPIIKAQCKQTLTTISAPTVQQLLGAIQQNEFALFVTLGEFSSDAIKIERGKSNLRLIKGSDLVRLVLDNYEKLEPRFKAILPLTRTYIPSVVSADGAV